MTYKKYNITKPKKDYYQEITDVFIELLETEKGNFVKTWQDNNLNGHYNIKTKKAYRGTNIFTTSISSYKNGFKSNEWGSFKQWQEKGFSVNKGAKATFIIFFSKIEIEDKKEKEKKLIPLIKGFPIFNADQTNYKDSEEYLRNINLLIEHGNKLVFNNSRIDNLVSNTKAIVKHGGNSAFYSPTSDFIQMPNKESFKEIKEISKEVGYYSTLLHELSHWTGNSKRLNREIFNRFGSNAYAFEELVAEISSGFLCTMLELVKMPTPNHAKYINNWLEVLKSDKKAIVKAFSLAQKASDFILDHEEIKELEEVA